MEALIKEIRELKKENQRLKKIIREIEKILKIQTSPKTALINGFQGVKEIEQK